MMKHRANTIEKNTNKIYNALKNMSCESIKQYSIQLKAY